MLLMLLLLLLLMLLDEPHLTQLNCEFSFCAFVFHFLQSFFPDGLTGCLRRCHVGRRMCLSPAPRQTTSTNAHTHTPSHAPQTVAVVGLFHKFSNACGKVETAHKSLGVGEARVGGRRCGQAGSEGAAQCQVAQHHPMQMRKDQHNVP